MHNRITLFSYYQLKPGSGLGEFISQLQKKHNLIKFDALTLFGYLQFIRIHCSNENLFVKGNGFIIRVAKGLELVFSGRFIHMNQLRSNLLKHLRLVKISHERPSTCSLDEYEVTAQEYETPAPLREELPLIRPLDMQRKYLLLNPVLFSFIQPFLSDDKDENNLYSFSEVIRAFNARLISKRKKYFSENEIVICDYLLKRLLLIDCFHYSQLSTLILSRVEEQIEIEDVIRIFLDSVTVD